MENNKSLEKTIREAKRGLGKFKDQQNEKVAASGRRTKKALYGILMAAGIAITGAYSSGKLSSWLENKRLTDSLVETSAKATNAENYAEKADEEKKEMEKEALFSKYREIESKSIFQQQEILETLKTSQKLNPMAREMFCGKTNDTLLRLSRSLGINKDFYEILKIKHPDKYNSIRKHTLNSIRHMEKSYKLNLGDIENKSLIELMSLSSRLHGEIYGPDGIACKAQIEREKEEERKISKMEEDLALSRANFLNYSEREEKINAFYNSLTTDETICDFTQKNKEDLVKVIRPKEYYQKIEAEKPWEARKWKGLYMQGINGANKKLGLTAKKGLEERDLYSLVTLFDQKYREISRRGLLEDPCKDVSDSLEAKRKQHGVK